METPTRLLALAFLIAAPAAASDLKLDGVSDADVAYGGAFQIELTGGAGLPAFVFVDGSPGPTFLFGESIPLGFTPLMSLMVSGATDGAGSFQTPFFLAEDPTHAGITLFLAGVLLDGTDPNGLDVSNGASLTIVPKAGAGGAQATLVGRPTAFDGSGASLSDGSLAVGTTIAWDVVSRPSGSAADLTDRDQLFPWLTPDVPGDYTVRVTVSKSGVENTDEGVLHAYGVDLTPSLDGQYVLGTSTSVQGTIHGPPVASAVLNGAVLSVGAFGDFGPVTEVIAAGDVFKPLLFELSHPDGSATRERFTVAQGLPLPLTFNTTKALAARLNPAGYDLVEGASEELLLDSDIASLLLAAGRQQIALEEGLFGFVIFSATLEFTSMSHGAITVDLAPVATGVAGAVRIHDVNVNFDVFGKVLEIPYDLTGSMQTDPAVINATLGLTPSGGELKATMQNLSVDLQGFNFGLDGFIGGVAELFIIESSVKSDVEAAVGDTITAEFPPAIEEILTSFVIAGNLFETLEVDVNIAAPITGVVNGTSGTTIQLDGQVSVGAVEPGSPSVTSFRSSISSSPVFGSTTPSGAPYGAALAVADDFLNQVLAAGTGAGLLDGDMTTLFEGTKGIGELFFTDVLAVLFPDAGFAKFPSGTQVSLISHGTMPPIVRTTPGGPALGRIDMSDMEAVFGVDSPGGTIPVLRISIDAGAELDLTIGSDGMLTALLGEASVNAQALQGMSGANLTLLDEGIEFLEGVLLPQLTKLFAGIPLPSLEAQGIGLAPSEVELIGGGFEYSGFFGDLVLIPLP